jgi:hypothetical protein
MRLLRASLVISIALGAAACADQGGSQIIVLNHAIPAEGCVLTAAESGTFISAGDVDAVGVLADRTSTGYYVTPLVKNVSDSADGTLETERTVILHGARVEIVIGTRIDGSALLSDAQIADLEAVNALAFTIPFSGSVGPDGGIVVFGFDAVPRVTLAAIGQALSPEYPEVLTSDTALIQIVYRVFGETTFGAEVEADPFTFPVTVCTGCLFRNIGLCTQIDDGEFATGGACNAFQYDLTDCCEQADGSVICPPVPQDPPA